MSKPSKNHTILSALKSAGFSIKIEHHRRIRLKDLSLTDITEIRRYRRKVPTDASSNEEVVSTGGRTVARLTRDGATSVGVAECSNLDNFCYKKGTYIAIQRATGNFKNKIFL